eukprot:UN1699
MGNETCRWRRILPACLEHEGAHSLSRGVLGGPRTGALEHSDQGTDELCGILQPILQPPVLAELVRKIPAALEDGSHLQALLNLHREDNVQVLTRVARQIGTPV